MFHLSAIIGDPGINIFTKKSGALPIMSQSRFKTQIRFEMVLVAQAQEEMMDKVTWKAVWPDLLDFVQVFKAFANN